MLPCTPNHKQELKRLPTETLHTSLSSICRHLELEEMTSSFNLLVGRRGKIFLVYSYHLLLLHTNKNISPKEGSWCSYILSIWLPVVSLSFLSSSRGRPTCLTWLHRAQWRRMMNKLFSWLLRLGKVERAHLLLHKISLITFVKTHLY